MAILREKHGKFACNKLNSLKNVGNYKGNPRLELYLLPKQGNVRSLVYYLGTQWSTDFLATFFLCGDKTMDKRMCRQFFGFPVCTLDVRLIWNLCLKSFCGKRSSRRNYIRYPLGTRKMFLGEFLALA